MRKICLIPSVPTPNGKLHVGHIAGPYLKMDVIKRYQEIIGNQACLVSGIDIYDSYVALQAFKENTSPKQIAQKYYKEIKKDFEKFNIHFDQFINPFSRDYYKKYQKISKYLADKVLKSNSAYLKTELFPINKKTKQFLPASFLQGKCPNCGEDLAGLTCETCCFIHQPEKISSLSSKVEAITLEMEETKSFFF